MIGCGNDDDTNSGVNYDKPSEAFDALFMDFCDKAIECKDTAPDGVPEFESAAQCVTLLKAQLGIDLDAMDASASAGRIEWDADDASYCLSGASTTIGAASCADFWDDGFEFLDNEDARCDDLGMGTVANGGACTIDQDCAAENATCVEDVCTAEV